LRAAGSRDHAEARLSDPRAERPAWDGGCRTQLSEETRTAFAEVHARVDVRDDVATNRPLATDEIADFGTHPQKRSSGLAMSLCDSLRALR
jgi:hypothetical protein